MKAHEAITALQAMDPETEIEEIKKVKGWKRRVADHILTMIAIAAVTAFIYNNCQFSWTYSVERMGQPEGTRVRGR